MLHPPVATATSTNSPAVLFAPWLFLLLPTAVSAQFAPNDPKDLNLTTVKSPINDAITVSYKTPDGACKTAFDHQQQYTGWVNVPSGTDGGDADYETNLFFWFVEAREPTTALTIWLNGGPGSSSMFGFFTGNGPCEVVEEGEDKLATVTREWGWDRASNMLFIDQVSFFLYKRGISWRGLKG
jgi:carboxypeptidase C (cathepsin A)